VSPNRSRAGFALLLLALSVPFWLAGAATGVLLPARLRVSSLMAVCPMLAAPGYLLDPVRQCRFTVAARVLIVWLYNTLLWRPTPGPIAPSATPAASTRPQDSTRNASLRLMPRPRRSPSVRATARTREEPPHEVNHG
jgi:hypothetical protein